jgi:hypothetical protein
MSKCMRLATINILVDTDNSAAACDAISNALGEVINTYDGERNIIIDWSYVRIGMQWLYPTELVTDDTYIPNSGEFDGEGNNE